MRAETTSNARATIRSTTLQQDISTESLVWWILSALALWRNPLKGSVIVACSKCFLYILFSQWGWIPGTTVDDDRSATLWRRSPSSSSNAQLDHQGIAMSYVLVPVLLQSMARSSQRHRPNLEFLAMVANFPSCELLGMRIAVVALIASMVGAHPEDWRALAPTAAVMTGLYCMNLLLVRQTPSLQGVFTQGEWDVISSLTSAAVAHAWVLHYDSTEFTNSNGTVHHGVVAAAGLLGCWFACNILRCLAWLRLQATQLWPVKLAILSFVPLTFVEMALRSVSHVTIRDNFYIPRCILWLFNFLCDREQSPVEAIWWLPQWSRLGWLVYWAVTLVVALCVAPNVNDTTSVTMARKWFHFVACLLFVPVTLAAPQLQSLSYAIALAILMVLECLRHDLTWLNAFYWRYVDHDKDSIGSQQKQVVIISHMALIAGCAIPLWIAEYLDPNFASPTTTMLLVLWGVLSLGVGDAMGALVGTYMGRHRWGSGNRTIEGSLAMLGSMALPCWLWMEDDIRIWLPAVLFTTLLETFTSQIDNLVLPLAGCAMILLCQR